MGSEQFVPPRYTTWPKLSVLIGTEKVLADQCALGKVIHPSVSDSFTRVHCQHIFIRQVWGFHQMSGTPRRLLRPPRPLVIGVAAPTNPRADADGHQHCCQHNPGNKRHCSFLSLAQVSRNRPARLGIPNRPLPSSTVFTTLLVEGR